MTSYMTVGDVAAALNFTPKTVREWCKQGVFPNAAKWPDNRPTAEWRIPRSDYEHVKATRFAPPQPVPNDRLEQLMNAAMERETTK